MIDFALRVLGVVAAATLAASASDATHPLSSLFSRTCLSCHGPEKQKGDFRVDTLTWPVSSSAQAESWRQVMERLENREMPPPKATSQPSVNERGAAVGAITRELARAAQTLGGGQQDALRRLNREQYQNTLRDLLGIQADLADFLPEDAHAYGFDRIGAALNLSGEQINAYLSAGEFALLDAMPPVVERPESPTVVAGLKLTEGPKNDRQRKDVRVLPDDGGTVAFKSSIDLTGVKLPVVGRYRIRITHAAYQAAADQVVYGRLIQGGETIAFFEARPGAPVQSEFEVNLGIGKGLSIAPLLDYPKRIYRSDYTDYTGAGLLIRRVEVTGPLIDTWPERGVKILFDDLPLQKRDGHGRLFAEKAPTSRDRHSVTVTSRDHTADATRLLRQFLPQAFRRPVSDAEVAGFVQVALAELATSAKPNFHAAMNLAYTAVLCSPDFLFINERAGTLDDYAIASRLSYFLIGSMPDAELFAAAAAGRLRQPAGRVAQAQRLLASPQASRFIHDFVGQWLDLRNLDATSPDTKLYPEFDPVLLDSMRQETELFFAHVLSNDLSVMEFVDSSWTFLNSRLAKHYGIPGVEGIALRRVTLPKDSHRGGVITHASVLKVTANGTVTSPVHRGKWLLERIIGRPPSPPPPDIPAIESDVRGATTIREQMAKHRDDASCASCHTSLDPHGFALENFDVIGGWRTNYRILSKDGKKVPGVEYKLGTAVEAGDVMPDGRRFTVVDEYQTLLLDEREQIARAMVERLLVYAFGRATTFADRPLIDQILITTRGKQHGLRSLILGLVASDRFATK